MNEEHISKAIRNQFKFKIENKTDKVRRVAIIPAYLQKLNALTSKLEVVTGKDATGEFRTKEIITLEGITYASPELLVNKGYPVDVVLADETFAFDDPDKSFTMSASDPSLKI